MLNDVGHLLLLLLPLVGLFLQISDLLYEVVETVSVWRTIGNRANESRVGIFKRLNLAINNGLQKVITNRTYCVLFLASQLARGLEVDSEVGEVAFIALAGILDSVDVERNSEAMDREDDRLGFAINEDLQGGQDYPWGYSGRDIPSASRLHPGELLRLCSSGTSSNPCPPYPK